MRTIAAGGSILLSGTLSAVDVKDFAGNEGGAFEIEHRIDDFLHFAHPSDRMSLGQEFIHIGLMHGRFGRTRRHALTRIPFLAYSIARDFVAAFKPPFVSAASTDGARLFAFSSRLLVICTMCPDPRFSISVAARRVIWKKPLRLIANMLE